MTDAPVLALLLAVTLIGALAAVYLLSNNPQRRRRAWQLLRLLLKR